MKITLLTLITLTSFSAITEQQSPRTFKKVVDENARKVYYTECKQMKQKGCHMFAFEKAIKLEEITNV